MARIPNYYFNSPYIADAARNLASALAPPDPEKTLAAQRSKWEFDRMQELAAVQDKQIAAHETGRAALGHIFLNPTAGTPVPHSPGEASWISQQYPNGVPTGPDPNDVQAVLNSDIPMADLFSVMGEMDPEYRKKLALAIANGDMRGEQLDRRLQSAEEIARRRGEGIDERFDITNQRIQDMQTSQQAFQAEQNRLKREQELKIAKEKKRIGASGNPRPIHVGPAQREVLRKAVVRKYSRYGILNPPPAEVDAITERALGYYGEGYNEAPDLAFNEFHGDKEAIPGEKNTWSADKPGSWPLRDDMTLEDIRATLPPLGLPDEEEPAATVPRPSQLPPMGDPTADNTFGGVFSGGQPGLFGQTTLNSPPFTGTSQPPLPGQAQQAQQTIDKEPGEPPPMDWFVPPEQAITVKADDGTTEVWMLVNGVRTRMDGGG